MGGLLYPLPAGFKKKRPAAAKATAAPGAPKAPRRKPIQREAIEQRALIAWSNIAVRTMPELAYLFHPGNGGRRDSLTASLMKAEGVRPGVPDLWLMKPRGAYHGLVIELKPVGSVPSDLSPDQRKWLRELQADGFCAYGCDGWEVARVLILEYLRLTGGSRFPTGILKLPTELWISKAHVRR